MRIHSQASSYNAVKGMQIFLADSTDESMSFRYFKYRLLVTYLIDRKGLTFHQIVEQDFDLKALEEDIRLEVKRGTFALTH